MTTRLSDAEIDKMREHFLSEKAKLEELIIQEPEDSQQKAIKTKINFFQKNIDMLEFL